MKRIWLPAALIVWAAVGWRHPDGEAAAVGATRAPLEPVPYRFEIEEVLVSSRGRVLMKDGFDREGVFRPAEVAGRPATVPYLVNMGLLDGSFVRDGRLIVQETCAINPFENFACDFSIPIDERGRYSFVGKEYFGDLTIDAKIVRPRIVHPEKFKIGLVDDTMFFSAAMVSLEKDVINLQRQGGEPRTLTPFLETTFDEVDVTSLGVLDEVDLRLTVDATGRPSGRARVRAGGSVQVFSLTAKEPWARLSPQGRYSVHVFIEDLAKPRIFSVYPETVEVEQLRASGRLLKTRIFGIGFGEDSVIEFAREGGGTVQAPAADIHMFNMGANASVTLPDLEPGTYSVRIHTSGMSATVERGFRVLP